MKINDFKHFIKFVFTVRKIEKLIDTYAGTDKKKLNQLNYAINHFFKNRKEINMKRTTTKIHLDNDLKEKIIAYTKQNGISIPAAINRMYGKKTRGYTSDTRIGKNANTYSIHVDCDVRDKIMKEASKHGLKMKQAIETIIYSIV